MTGASITSMAERTLGGPGAKVVSVTYLLLHNAMLVACAAPAVLYVAVQA